MTTVNKNHPKKRIFYLDALRALAIISVILFHVYMQCNHLVIDQFAVIPSLDWFACDFLGSCFRIGVDIFLMLSGALSLGRNWEIKPFLSKRLPRITMPFLFWGFSLSLVVIYLSTIYPNWYHTIDPYNITEFLKYLLKSFMSENSGFTQYWFFWMIMGTYLIMPIINRWLYNADLKEAEYFLVIWAITCTFTHTLGFDFPIQLTYFDGAIGMVVLGYYLRHTERKIFNNPYIAILLIIIGASTLMSASYLTSSASLMNYVDRYSILNAVLVTGVFCLFKTASKFNIDVRMYSENGIFKRSVVSIAKYSYGIYLIHRVVMNFIYFNMKHEVTFIPLMIILFVGSILISWLVLSVLNRVPYLNQVIGAK